MEGTTFLIAAVALLAVTDYAESRNADCWLRHPVYGDPSFDSYVRAPGNPILRGSPPFTWPVNGFLFEDPVSKNWYAFVGEYMSGYGGGKAQCGLLRSTDKGKTWEKLGPVVEGDAATFDKGGYTPDVSVVYADGRYHMVYDWNVPEVWGEGGLAYAWSDKPEGPWHRAKEPITNNSKLSKLLGKYQRTYGGTLIKRKHDWMIVGLMDAAPHSWSFFGMTSPHPEGPYGERVLLRNVEIDTFHPPLMEGYPAVTHDGYVYAPTTSVALNRDFNAVFRAPLEKAMDPSAWEVYQFGSVWHSESVENEREGIWGQTYSGFVDAAGTLHSMFPSRDKDNLGTINIASRPWSKPLRERGFVLSAHQGPSMTVLRRAYGAFRLEATLRVTGVVRLLLDYHAPIGPNAPISDATLHALMNAPCTAAEISEKGVRVGTGDWSAWGGSLVVEVKPDGAATVSAGGNELWKGKLADGLLGLWCGPHSRVAVDSFKVTGEARPAKLSYLCTEAVLGAGGKMEDFEEATSDFRYKTGVVAKQEGPRVKWNVVGNRVTLWSPRGPGYGQVEVRVDGKTLAKLDLHAEHGEPSKPVWRSGRLRGPYHAVVLQAVKGRMPVDCLEVEG